MNLDDMPTHRHCIELLRINGKELCITQKQFDELMVEHMQHTRFYDPWSQTIGQHWIDGEKTHTFFGKPVVIIKGSE